MEHNLKDTKVIYSASIHIMCDNTSAINISNNIVIRSRTKAHFYLTFINRESCREGSQIRVWAYKESNYKYIHQGNSKDTFEYLCQKLGVTAPPSSK